MGSDINGAARHTPGPWRVCDGAILSEGLNEFGNWHVCQFHRGDEKNTPQDFANAALIAAAPELLAALERLIAASELTPGDCYTGGLPNANWGEPGRAADQARAAIAKARQGGGA